MNSFILVILSTVDFVNLLEEKHLKSKDMGDEKNSNFAVFVLISVTLYMPCVGFAFVAFNPLTPILKRMFNETYQDRYNETLPESTWIPLLSVTSSSLVIGTIIGGLISRVLLHILSRKRNLQVCHTVSLLAIFVTAFVGKSTAAYEIFIFGRILSGISIGIGYTITPIMIAEICARPRQSFWQCVSQACAGFGVVVGAVLTHPQILGTSDLWPIALAMGAVPSVIFLPASFFMPNTPFYLARKEKNDEAMTVLKTLRVGDEVTLEEEYKFMTTEMEGTKVLGLLKILKTRQYRLQFIAVLCLYSNLQLTGVVNIIFYSDRIFRMAGVPNNVVTNATIGIFTGKFIVSLIGPKLVDRFGGRKVLMISCALQILALTLFTLSQALLYLAPIQLPYVSIAAIALFMLPHSCGTNLATTAVAVAVTIEPTRATIIGSVMPVFFVLSWFVGFIPPYLEVAFGAYSLCLWLFCTLIFLVYFFFFLPETRRRSVAQIQAKFAFPRTISKLPLTEQKSTQSVHQD